MRDYYLVNIKYEGVIPFINVKGPVFGYPLNPGVYSLMLSAGFPYLEETTPNDAKLTREKYLESKKKVEQPKIIVEKKTEPTKEQLQITDSVKVEISKEDEEIDKILEHTPFKSAMEVQVEKFGAVLTLDGSKLTNEEIETLNKAQCKKVLEARGYKSAKTKFEKSSPLAAKYHDSIEDLRNKVKKTQ